MAAQEESKLVAEQIEKAAGVRAKRQEELLSWAAKTLGAPPPGLAEAVKDAGLDASKLLASDDDAELLRLRRLADELRAKYGDHSREAEVELAPLLDERTWPGEADR